VTALHWRPAPAPWLGWAVLGTAFTVVVALGVGRAFDLPEISAGEWAIISLRLIVPVLILRYWLVGGVAAMLLDAADVVLIEAIGLGGFGDHYAELDKVLDSYYYALELWVALQWANPWARAPAAALFAYRLVGVGLFEATHARIMLFAFPNMFENWWLYVVVVMKWFPALAPRSWKSLAIPMAALLVPKMAQEYVLHFAEAKPWDWIKRSLLQPMGIEI
jgi:hypothetical protein